MDMFFYLEENSGGSLIFLQKDSGAAAQAQLIFGNIIGGSAAGVLSPNMIWILAIPWMHIWPKFLK